MLRLECALNILLVAQAAVAVLVAGRELVLRAVAHGLTAAAEAGLGPALLVPASIGVALLSGAAVTMSHWRLRLLRELRARNDSLRVAVDTDSLTGLGNRRAFDAAVDAALRDAVHERAGLSLIVIDIDHFKAFNDSYGHVEGDRVLRETGRAISEVLEGDTIAYRIGGEELAVILPGIAITDAARRARLIQGAVEGMRRPHTRGVGGILTVSIGVAEAYPAIVPIVADTLLEAADRALYEAKNSGRACVRLAAFAPPPASAGAATIAAAAAEDTVDGLDILLPNGSRLAIRRPLRLATVNTILRMVAAAGAEAEAEAAE